MTRGGAWACPRSVAMTGASHGFPQAAAPVGVFSRGMTRTSGSLSCGAREPRVICTSHNLYGTKSLELPFQGACE